jgi:7,8-dihydroneopterin aldolase/epimerase/oxygenase
MSPGDRGGRPTDRVTLRGIEVFAHHGVLAHERELGQRFVVDVTVWLDTAEAAATDDLQATVDYGELAGAVAAAATDPPAALIETVADRVADVVLADHRVTQVEVTVHKPAAPLPVAAADVAVTVHRSR